MTSKWSEPGWPHKGWNIIASMDTGAYGSESCEACGTSLRYVWELWHPEKELKAFVGCVCAEELAQDYESPKAQLKEMKRKKLKPYTEFSRGFPRASKDKLELTHRSLPVTLMRGVNGQWKIKVIDYQSDYFPTTSKAKKAAFAQLQSLGINT